MKPPALLKQQELVVWFLINDVAKRFFAAVDREMRSIGLTRAQWYLLTHVYYFEGLTQTELSEKMDLTKSSAAKLVRKLEMKRWIYREDDAGDGRIQRVYLVSELRPMIQALAQVAHSVLVGPLSVLSQADMKQLKRTLRKIESGLDNPLGRSIADLEGAKAQVESIFKQLRRSKILV